MGQIEIEPRVHLAATLIEVVEEHGLCASNAWAISEDFFGTQHTCQTASGGEVRITADRDSGALAGLRYRAVTEGHIVPGTDPGHLTATLSGARRMRQAEVPQIVDVNVAVAEAQSFLLLGANVSALAQRSALLEYIGASLGASFEDEESGGYISVRTETTSVQIDRRISITFEQDGQLGQEMTGGFAPPSDPVAIDTLPVHQIDVEGQYIARLRSPGVGPTFENLVSAGFCRPSDMPTRETVHFIRCVSNGGLVATEVGFTRDFNGDPLEVSSIRLIMEFSRPPGAGNVYGLETISEADVADVSRVFEARILQIPLEEQRREIFWELGSRSQRYIMVDESNRINHSILKYYTNSDGVQRGFVSFQFLVSGHRR